MEPNLAVTELEIILEHPALSTELAECDRKTVLDCSENTTGQIFFADFSKSYQNHTKIGPNQKVMISRVLHCCEHLPTSRVFDS